MRGLALALEIEPDQSVHLEALESFLRDKLDYALSRQKFAADLTEILQVNLAEDQPEEVAQRLAREYAW